MINIKTKICCNLMKVIKKSYYILNYRKLNPKINPEEVDKVLFTAHPDDEILFFSKELINNSGWLVVCITNGDNHSRSKEFMSCMNEINAKYNIWDFEDDWCYKWNLKKINKKIRKILSLKKEWHKVVTHNEEGEYGHPQHIRINNIIKKLYDGENFYTSAPNDFLAKEENKLEEMELGKKIKILKEYYKSQNFVFEDLKLYCEYEKVL